MKFFINFNKFSYFLANFCYQLRKDYSINVTWLLVAESLFSMTNPPDVSTATTNNGNNLECILYLFKIL